MTRRRRRKQGRFKRWFAFCAVLLALIAAAFVTAWWKRSLIVEKVLASFAQQEGFTSASLGVDRVGLANFVLSDVLLETDGFTISLSSVRADYSLYDLFSGSIADLQLDGLEVTLDFNRPRSGLLPNGLVALIGEGGGGGFRFPVDSFKALGGRLTTIFPEESHLFSLDMTGERRTDGRIGFGLKMEHPDQHLAMEGVVLTESLDAEISLTAKETRPELYLSIARQLGLFEMVEGITFDSSSMDAEGNFVMEKGAFASVSGSFHLPAVGAVVDGTALTLTDVHVASERDSSDAVSGAISGRIAASNEEQKWKTSEMLIEASFTGGALQGSIQDLAYTRPEFEIQGSVEQFFVKSPWSPDDAHVTAEFAVESLSAGAVAVEPFLVQFEGGADAVVVNVPRVTFDGGPPIEVVGLACRVDSPLGDGKVVSGHLSLNIRSLLELGQPGGWHFERTDSETSTVSAQITGKAVDSVFDGFITWESEIPRVRAKRTGSSVAFSPSVFGRMAFGSGGVSAESTIELRSVEQDLLSGFPELNGIRCVLSVPTTPFETVWGILERDCAGSDFSATLKGEVFDSKTEKKFSLKFQRESESESWSTAGLVTSRDDMLSIGGMTFSGLEIQKTVSNDGMSDSGFFRLMDVDNMGATLEDFVAGANADGTITANSIDLPSGIRLEWVSASISKAASLAAKDLWKAQLDFNSGVVRVAGERFEQVHGDFNLNNGINVLNLSGRLEGIVEGSSIAVDLAEEFTVDWANASFAAEGVYSIPAFRIANSGFIGRRVPQLRDMVAGATVSGHGNLRFDSGGDWDASAYLSVGEGSIDYPGKEVRLSDLEMDLSLESVRELRTLPSQALRFANLQIGNLLATNGSVDFRLNGPDQVFIEDAAVHVFGGVVSTRAFSLFFPDPDVAVDLLVDGLDVDQVVRHFDLFDGEVTGRLKGHVPIGLLAGKPVFGEGLLVLDDQFPSTLAYRTHGAFTEGLPKGNSLTAQINRIGYELLEEGLEKLNVESMEIRLFDREFPQTPIRIRVTGRSQTDRALVPIVLDTNVNGSVAEVLDFIYRFLVL